MQLSLFRIVLLSILLLNISYAKSKLYLLPQDSKQCQKDIIKLFQNSKKSINIAMYNFKYKKFIKELQKANKRGVDINLYLDNKKAKTNNTNFFKYKTFENKLHIKAVLFDNNTVVFGSANWKKESFKDNMEIIYISNEKQIVKQFKNMFQTLSTKIIK